MADKQKRIGISGGTFDPIHLGHLIIAEKARECLMLEKVVFIPTGDPPHKEGMNVTDAVHRYNMVCEAISTNPDFEASRIEVDRLGFSYTIDTLTELKSTFDEDSRFFFITGADVVYELLTWKEYEKVFAMCEFAAVMRPGFEKDDVLNRIKSLKERFGAEICLIDIPLIGISSTLIRDNIVNGRSVKYLIPERVERYIYKHGLYR